MVPGWLTILVLAFGIAVAIVGVAAYLRIYRKDRLTATVNETFSQQKTDHDHSRSTQVWNKDDLGQNRYVDKASEQSKKSDCHEKSEH